MSIGLNNYNPPFCHYHFLLKEYIYYYEQI